MRKVIFHVLSFPNKNKLIETLAFYEGRGVTLNTDPADIKVMSDIEVTGDLMTLCNLANSLGLKQVLCVVKAVQDVNAEPFESVYSKSHWKLTNERRAFI